MKRGKTLFLSVSILLLVLSFPAGQAVPVCDDLHPTEIDDFYVDGASLCGSCSDDGPGTVDQPWCTFERAFSSRTPHLEGSGKLYIRDGKYRFDSVTLGTQFSAEVRDISGTPQNPTVISGYPGEKPMIYFSDRVQGWTEYAERPEANIWVIDWGTNNGYLQTHHLWQYLYPSERGTRAKNIAQVVAIDENPTILFQQINSLKNGWTFHTPEESWADSRFPGGTTSVGTNQFDMDQGNKPTFYYENETTSPYFGKLFIWLPDGTNPNNRNVEVSVSPAMPFAFADHPMNYIHIKDLTTRFAGGHFGSIILSGSDNRFENLDASYGGFTGLAGLCKNCVVKNSIFRFNGNSGAGLQGENTIYEGNIIEDNNWRKYNRGWHAGGIKFTQGDIARKSTTNNMTFRNNLVKNNFGWGVWFDFALMENALIEGNMIVNNSFDGIRIEVAGGTAEKPAKIRNNILINNGKGTFGDELDFAGGIVLSGSRYVIVDNNLVYDSPAGVTEINVGTSEYPLRQNAISNNIFLNVSFPLTIPRQVAAQAEDNTANNNLFINSGPSFFWDRTFAWADDPNDPAERDWIALKERNNRQIFFCYGWCYTWQYNAQNFTQWQALGFDQNSVQLPDQPIDLALYGIDLNQVGDPAQSIAALRRDLWPAFEDMTLPEATYHVNGSYTGSVSDGSKEKPWKTIAEAAAFNLLPGDSVTVHPGTYRETVRLNHNGTTNKPIAFLADGEVIIKGSDPIIGWESTGGAIYSHQNWIYKEPYAVESSQVSPGLMLHNKLRKKATNEEIDYFKRTYGNENVTVVQDWEQVDLNWVQVQKADFSKYYENLGITLEWTRDYENLNIIPDERYWNYAENDWRPYAIIKNWDKGQEFLRKEFPDVLYSLSRNQIFVDEKPLREVVTKDALTPGTFYIDPETKELSVYLADSSNPATHTMEGSTRDALVHFGQALRGYSIASAVLPRI